MSEDVRLQILHLLKVRFEAPEGSESIGGDLDELAAHFDLPKQEVRDHVTVLETRGFVNGTHTGGGDPNPGFIITDAGKTYVIERR